MITRIREVRRARKMTLDDVARACEPPTTPQTIGRLETGTRTVSVGWLNRIAAALGVEASDLVDRRRATPELEVAAILGANGAAAPKRTGDRRPAAARKAGQVAVTVAASAGDYRAGDEIWCDTLQPDEFAARAQPRRAGPPPRRPLPVRPADRPRRRQAAPAAARRGRPPERRHRPAVDRGGGETGPEPLAAPAVEPPMFFMFSNRWAADARC